jgi:CheY-like chemotaxis protein
MPGVSDVFNFDGRRIAIVDDIPENLKLLKSLFEKKGAQVFLFPSGEMALRAFAKNVPDLILLDINMPGLNGYQVCQRLREVGGVLADVPVIFVSAQDDVEAKTTAFTKGGVDYICKPFQAEEVEARVATHLELALKRKQMRILLDSTLTGAVRALFEVLTVYNPELCRYNLKISQVVRGIASDLGLAGSWRYHMAALLYNFGELEYGKLDAAGNMVPRTTQGDFAAEILRNIPGLDCISEILTLPEPEFAPGMLWRECPYPEIGRHLLKVAESYELFIGPSGKTPEEALQIMHWKTRNYIGDMVDALERVVVDDLYHATDDMRVAQLAPGMVLAADVKTTSGVVLFSKGTELSFAACRSLYNREKTDVKDPVVAPIKVVRRATTRKQGNYI